MKLDALMKCKFGCSFWGLPGGFAERSAGAFEQLHKKVEWRRKGGRAVHRGVCVFFFLFEPHETCMRGDNSRCVLFMQTAESCSKYCK